MNTTVRGYVLVIISGVVFGFTPIFSKLLYAAGMNVFSVLTQRFVLSAVIFFILIRYVLKEPVRVSRSEFKRLAVIALFSSMLTPMFLQSSYLYIPSGMATTLHFVYPVITVLESGLIFKEKIGKLKWLCVASCTLGIVMFYNPGGDINLLGVVLALASGVTFGTYMVLVNHLGVDHIHPFKVVFYNSLLGGLVFGGFSGLTGQLHIPLSAYTICIALISTVFSGILGSSFLQTGIRIIGAQRSAILSTCEPVTSIIFGIIIFGDQISAKAVVGIALILASVISLTLFDRDKQEAEPDTALDEAQKAEKAAAVPCTCQDDTT